MQIYFKVSGEREGGIRRAKGREIKEIENKLGSCFDHDSDFCKTYLSLFGTNEPFDCV